MASAKLNIDNIYISGFNVGILATDVIAIFHLSNSTFYTETFHVEGVSTGLTRPNSWNLSDNIFAFAADAAVFLVHPAMVNILNNNFELNGTNLSLSPATIIVSGFPIDGNIGVNIQGNYFEGGQNYEIVLQALSGDTGNASFIISNNFLAGTATMRLLQSNFRMQLLP